MQLARFVAPGDIGESGAFASPPSGPVRLEMSVAGITAPPGGRRVVVGVLTATR